MVSRSPRPQTSRFLATPSAGEVASLLLRPRAAFCLYVLAHGAGVGMRHHFLQAMSLELASHGVATLRYQFPYMEAGRRRPDRPPVLEATVRSAIGAARTAAPDLPLIAGGKSMGGRMTSRAAAERPLPGVQGLAFLGFPLHPAGKPSVERAEHLDAVEAPMLFLQGTRDRLAELSLLESAIDVLGKRASLHLVTDGDHSFHVLKRSDRTDEEVVRELAETIARWARKVLRSEVVRQLSLRNTRGVTPATREEQYSSRRS